MKKTIQKTKVSKQHIKTNSIPEYISEILRTSGLRMTPQRKSLIEELEHSKIGLSIKEIYKKLNTKKVKIDEASVYRTIEALRNLDLIHSLSDGKYKLCSHIACEQSFHLSLICKKCNTVLEPHLDKSKESLIADSLNLKTGQIHNLQVHILCDNCLKTKST